MMIFKNIFEDIIQSIKNKLYSSKYIVKGKCKKCGTCCSQILFSNENGYIKDEYDFIKLQKTNNFYLNFKINGKVNDSANNFINGALLFKCRLLSKENKCKIYIFRPLFCRKYPKVSTYFIHNGGETFDECGYYFDIDKKFKEYLK